MTVGANSFHKVRRVWLSSTPIMLSFWTDLTHGPSTRGWTAFSPVPFSLVLLQPQQSPWQGTGPHLTIRFISFNLWVSLFLTFHTIYSYDGRERNLWNYEEKFAKCSPAKHALSDLLPLPSPWIFLDSTRNDITFFELKGWCCSLWASFDLQQGALSFPGGSMIKNPPAM